MKLGPIVGIQGRFRIELIFSPREIDDLGGEVAVQRMCERACEENVRAMNARIEYMRETGGGGFVGGTRAEVDHAE